MFRQIALIGMLILSAAAAHAQAPTARQTPMAGIDPSLLRGLEYRLIGPGQGGRVTTVTGVPSQPRTFYMGVASGGAFRTTDGGETWVPITDGQVPVGSMGDIAVANSDPNIIYIGTGSDGLRSNVSTGRGVYRTSDGGGNWQFAGLYDTGQIGAVRIHPTDANTVWVAANGDAFKRSAERGVFKTTDGGRTWKKTLFVSDSTGAMDVEIMPGNPNVVYAWMSRIERKPWSIISGSHEGGFYKSTDGGERWTRIMNTGLPTGLLGKGNLAVTAANPNRIYALIEALPDGGFYRSDDGGQTWQNMGANAEPALQRPFAAMLQRPFYYTTIGADPTNADVVYAGAESFFKSTDGGRTWTSLRTPHSDNHDIWISPNDGNTMVQANDGGANVSFDGGRTWSTQYNQPTAELYGVRMDDAFPYNIYAAQQDDGTHIISMVGPGDEKGTDTWRGGPGCETGPLVPHPSKKNIVYGSCKGQYEVLNLETGQSKQYWIGAQSLYGNPARDLILRFQRVSPMSLSPHDPDVLYYGSQHVHRTRDLGVTWETISPDLTANPDCCQGISGEPITRDITGEEFYSTLYAIEESPHEAGVIWTGSNDGPFHITRDNGRTWQNVTPKDLPPGGRVPWIDVSPHRPGSAYFAVYRYLLGDYQPYIYRTDDYGRTWKRLTDGKNGIPADWPTRVVREDPDREGLLYAGTEFGMFISFDNGANWQAFNLNMPNVPVTDIRVYRKDLIIATQGRGIWILDNLSALHQMGARQATEVTLYRPRDAYRTRTGANLLGPMIEYHLPAPPQGPVTIDILDTSGATVNSFSSAAVAAQGGGRGGRGGQTPAPGQGPLVNLAACFADEGVAAVLRPGTGNSHGGNVFVGSGGSRAADAPRATPQLALTPEHYGRIYRILEKGVPVTMDLDVRNTFQTTELNSFNVIAEIPGTDKADEIVMIGAHFDSWQAGTGATDNAAGSAVMMEAMRILKATGLPMRRTVRIGLWTGEEQGLIGSREYVTAHFADRATMQLKPEHAKFSAYYNVDNGTGAIRGIFLQGNSAVGPIFSQWMRALNSDSISVGHVAPGNTGGTDHQSFDAVGLPGFQFIQDPVEYGSRTHHSSQDVYERIQESDMKHNAVVVAAFVYLTANRDELLPREPLPVVQGGGGRGRGGRGGAGGQAVGCPAM